MNPLKSEIFYGGYNEVEEAVLSGISGFKIGAFPTRYMVFHLIQGNVKLISSVIYGIVIFSSLNKTESARGARVAWTDICKSKAEGGLRILMLEDFEKAHYGWLGLITMYLGGRFLAHARC
ncbi:unnamed protein product [Arabis nemorensis]|uniref:Uncharacterized protein n=1 Tax=Arabis nemorensis TaxID=586526 RepID=A0A565BDG3_9BRAS|nr:unnamed protein product [Arabis nemorensis]